MRPVRGAAKSMLPDAALRSLRRWRNAVRVELNRVRFDAEVHRRLLDPPRDASRFWLHIEGTNRCSALCAFCAYPSMQRNKQTMPMEPFRRIVAEYFATGGRTVAMTPIVGDPLIDKNVFERLDAILEYPNAKQVSLYTNAIALTASHAERLLRYENRLKLVVSWGGFDREAYHRIMGVDRFDTVDANVQRFLSLRALRSSTVEMVVAARCAARDCRGAAWDRLIAARHRGELRIDSTESFDNWAGRVPDQTLLTLGLRPRPMPHRRGPCVWLAHHVVVLADLRVNACPCRDVEASLVIADAADCSLMDVWRSPTRLSLIRRQLAGDFPEVCRRCSAYESVFMRDFGRGSCP